MATPITKDLTAPRLPSAAELATARATRDAIDADRANATSPGTVIGLDHAEWASAIVDLTDPEKREDAIAKDRRMMTNKGYVKADGAWRVHGFPNAEVWLKPRAQWLADREKRVQRQRDMVRRREMSESTFATTERLHVGGNYGN